MRFSFRRAVTTALCAGAFTLFFALHFGPTPPGQYSQPGAQDNADADSQFRSEDDKPVTHGTTESVILGVIPTNGTTSKFNPDELRTWLPDDNNVLPNFYTMRENHQVAENVYQSGMIVYLHHNKAAGSTTKQCLRTVSARSHKILGPILDSAGRVRTQNKVSSTEQNVSVLMGGYAFGICDALKDKKCSYFTIVRDPYERLISSYTYCRRAGGDQLCQPLSPWDASLKEWAVHQGSFFFRQLLMKAWYCTANSKTDPKFNNLTGIPHSPKAAFAHSPCWFKEKVILKRSLTPSEFDAILEYCVNHLEDWFSFIGITDEYDLSLAMLEDVYQLPFKQTCAKQKANVSNYKNLEEGGADGNSSALPDMVQKWKTELQQDDEVYNALKADIILYQKALDIFQRQKISYFSKLKQS